eukprot:3439255-Amphidinium_carterae.1
MARESQELAEREARLKEEEIQREKEREAEAALAAELRDAAPPVLSVEDAKVKAILETAARPSIESEQAKAERLKREEALLWLRQE